MKVPDKSTILGLAAAVVLHIAGLFATFELWWLTAASIIVAAGLVISASEI